MVRGLEKALRQVGVQGMAHSGNSGSLANRLPSSGTY